MATKAFFKLIGNRELSDSFQRLIDGEKMPTIGLIEEQPKNEKKEKPTVQPQPKPARSEAISLLAALQREARLVDIVKEPLDNYSDEQVGAAARDVLRDTGKVLDRMFDVEPLTDTADGEEIETPEQFDSAQFHLTGNVSGQSPFKGTLAHHGWQAKKCEVPKWTGGQKSSNIIAPIEIEIA